MISFAVDQSVEKCGIAMCNESLEYLGSETIKLPSKMKGKPRRLKYYYDAIKERLTSIKESDDLVVVSREGYLKSIAHAKMPFALGEIGGVMDLIFAELGFVEQQTWFAPPQGVWLKFITGKGRTGFTSADKKKRAPEYVAYLNACLRSIGLSELPKDATTDELDAFCMALCGRSFYYIYNNHLHVSDLDIKQQEAVVDDKKMKKSHISIKELGTVLLKEQGKLLKKMI